MVHLTRFIASAAAAAVMLAGAIVIAQPAAAIVDGTDSTVVEPSMARVNFPDRRFCGGTLVSEGWVLSAAHCVFSLGEILPPDSIRLGSLDKNHGGTLFGVEDVVIHPNAIGVDGRIDPHFDLALIKLDKPAEYEPMEIATQSPELGDTLRTMGWGDLSNQPCLPPACDHREYPDFLQEIVLPVVENDGGLLSMGDLHPIGTEGKQVGWGDSGGPALIQSKDGTKLAGVTSTADEKSAGSGTSLALSIFVDVVPHREWIHAVAGAR